jgi:hypothetical protein
MDKKAVMAKIQKMPMEEKLSLLSEIDKAYIRGYIEKAVLEQKRVKSSGKKRADKGSGK